ncbi:MAG: hypothetical protein WAT66_00475 [Actinomycetota bacterium]
MEDRQPTGLMIEMLDGPDAAAVEEWQRDVAIPKALANGWFSHGTAFRNLRQDETRFQQKIEGFTHLSVYEIARADVEWACMDGLARGEGGVRVTNRFLFKRYPRPSQGRLSGRPTRGIFLVLISPTTPDRAQELRDWADFTHIHGIAASSPDGFTTITPFENTTGGDPRFMHFYELDTDDVVASVDAMPEAVMKKFGFEMGDERFLKWALSDDLDIWYVNLFGRVD